MNYHSALCFIKKDIQLKSFLIFLQNSGGSSFPLMFLKARHRPHYNRHVSSASGIVCQWARVSLVHSCEITAVVAFALVLVSQYFSHPVQE